MNDLPAPTHVFIGGSSGKMEEVIALCLKKNPKTRFVVNLITPESLAAVLAAVKDTSGNGTGARDPDSSQIKKSRKQPPDDGTESGVDREL